MSYTRSTVRLVLAAGVAVLVGCVAVPLAAPIAMAAEPPPRATVFADLDGNGRPGPVTQTEISPDQRLVSADLGDRRVEAVVGEAGQFLPFEPPRVVDLDRDGRQELVVASVIGANTITWNVWEYRPDRGLTPITTAGSPLTLYEGGGIAAASGYGCTDHAGAGSRTLEFVTGALAGDPGTADTYDGSITTYAVRDGEATVVREVPFRGVPAGDPLLVPDPATCR
jgi:hypothetical protein